MDEVNLRVTLTDQLNNSVVISEPGGWDTASLGLVRHPQLLSCIEYFKSSFQLYGSNGSEDGGRDWVLAVEKRDGPDALIGVLVEIDSNNDLNYRTAFSGNLGVGLFIETLNQDHLLQVVFGNSDFWSKIMARWQTQVDLLSLADLDGNVITATPKFTLPLPSQIIHKTFLKQTTGDPTSSYLDFFAGAPITLYLKFDLNNITLDEIEGRQNYPTQIVAFNPVTDSKYDFKVKERGGYTFFSRPLFKITTDVNINGNVKWWITTGKPGAYTNQQIGITYSFVAKGFTSAIEELNPDLNLIINNYLVNLEVGDEIYIYGEFNITVTGGGGGVNATYIPGDAAHLTTSPYVATFQIRADTVAPNSTTEAFHTHDVAAGILDRISGRTGLFYSGYLGHQWTSRVYGATGCGSLKSNMKGLHIRGNSLVDKPFSPSMKDWMDGINPIDCLGLGPEKLAGADIVRCEQAPYFFDDSAMSILFSNVQTIKRSYDPDHQFNSVDYGYAKWQSQASSGVGSPSGIDDPQSQGTRNTIFKIIGKKFKILSTWLGASLSIETMRRLGLLASANYTYDDDIVVICLHSNGDGTFRPELDENYSAITNLLNSPTRYNTSISSTRNFRRWLTYLSGCLQSYTSSVFSFVPGQGNYTMTSTKTTSCPGDDTGEVVAENGDVAVGDEFLFLPMPFEIDHYMDFDDYVTLVANKNLAIGISQTDSGHKPFFIDDTSGLEYNIATGLIHLKAWPKEAFDIMVPETPSYAPSPGSIGKYFEQPYFETQFE